MWRRNLRVLVNFPSWELVIVHALVPVLVPGSRTKMKRADLPRQIPRERSW